MENLEEVLQALDEFQKMRPTEIPRELEDYLCWVAKTGDPVYQWSLIKTLFREKLTRVMTDFYESCPTLELAPCPNVEHFNYDTMKSTLLERLESFGSAPFTLQRICELLTAPRKEYNRVDKFMRAIEKNILVVSTREPGPIARRNENGDGMVNGSVDEDTSVTQPPQDVEMEYWEKDCPSTVTISVHTVENEAPMLHTVIPTTTVVKNVFGTDETSHDKESSPSKTDIHGSTFIPTTLEFSGVSSLTSQTQSQDSQIGHTIQNLSTIVPETSGIVGDVPEAIMNEDTSSQPSLDLENEDGDTTESTRKLQTTFQTKDFSSSENKSSKFYIDNSKTNEKSQAMIVPAQGESNKSDMESKTILDNKETVSPTIENFLITSNENAEPVTKGTAGKNTQTVIDTPGLNVQEKESIENTSIGTSLSSPEKPSCTLSTDDAINMKSEPEISSEESASANTTENVSVNVENTKGQSQTAESSEDPKPIVEEPCSEDNTQENFNSNQEKDNVTITEAVGDEARATKSLVPDPIPIIEEPKDVEAVSENIVDASPVTEVLEESESQNSTEECESDSTNEMSVESTDATKLEANNIVVKEKDEDMVMENVINEKRPESVELMEVDDEETSAYQQDDEPMEQEVVQSSKS